MDVWRSELGSMHVWRSEISSPAGGRSEQLARLVYELLDAHADTEQRDRVAAPRWVRRDNELGYLLRALRRNYANRLRTATRRPAAR
jgi:hypothetical protein